MHQQLQMQLASVLEYCHRRDASEASAIEALLKTRFDAGGTALTALGLGSAQKSVRRVGGAAGGYRAAKKQHIFIASLNTGEPAAPNRIKPGEACRKKKGRNIQGVRDRAEVQEILQENFLNLSTRPRYPRHSLCPPSLPGSFWGCLGSS